MKSIKELNEIRKYVFGIVTDPNRSDKQKVADLSKYKYDLLNELNYPISHLISDKFNEIYSLIDGYIESETSIMDVIYLKYNEISGFEPKLDISKLKRFNQDELNEFIDMINVKRSIYISKDCSHIHLDKLLDFLKKLAELMIEFNSNDIRRQLAALQNSEFIKFADINGFYKTHEKEIWELWNSDKSIPINRDYYKPELDFRFVDKIPEEVIIESMNDIDSIKLPKNSKIFIKILKTT